MEIRTATNDDADTVTDLWLDLAGGQRSYGSHILAEENRSTAREAVFKHVVADELTVAIEDDEILGFVMFAVESSDYAQDTSRGLVRNIYVAPDHRRQGIGTALLKDAERRLRDRGVDRLALEVMAENESARRFYQRHGYTPHRISLEKPTENDTL